MSLLASLQGLTAVLTFPTFDPPQLKAVLRMIDRATPRPRPGTPAPYLKAIGAYVDDHVPQSAGIKNLCTIPSLDTLRAQLVELLSAPEAQLTGGLDQARGRRLARTLDELQTSLEENSKGKCLTPCLHISCLWLFTTILCAS